MLTETLHFVVVLIFCCCLSKFSLTITANNVTVMNGRYNFHKWNDYILFSVKHTSFLKWWFFISPTIFIALESDSNRRNHFLFIKINIYQILYFMWKVVASKHPYWYQKYTLIQMGSYLKKLRYLWKACCRSPFKESSRSQ